MASPPKVLEVGSLDMRSAPLSPPTRKPDSPSQAQGEARLGAFVRGLLLSPLCAYLLSAYCVPGSVLSHGLRCRFSHTSLVVAERDVHHRIAGNIHCLGNELNEDLTKSGHQGSLPRGHASLDI